MNQYHLSIGGKSIAGANFFDVINPATEQIVAAAPAATEAHVDQAVTAAQNAFKEWQHSSFDNRVKLAADMAASIEREQTALALLLSAEQGKPVKSAHDEIAWALAGLNEIKNLQLEPIVLREDTEASVKIVRKPLGVVAAITPWNYPLSLAIGNIIAALACGNTVVVKPSPYTPLTSLRLGEILQSVVPPGTVNIISGDNQVGEWLTEHPGVNKINFTGSVITGQKIMAVAARDVKRITLEMGGNDPAIVLADADPIKIAHSLFWGAFSNCGQVCVAIKRLFVHEKVYEPLLAELVSLAQKTVVGIGTDEKTEMGPLNNKAQLLRIEELVADAKKQGAKIRYGGERLARPGYFYPPTLVTDIDDHVRLVCEEQFGPVLPILKFTDVEDAIRRANQTKLGLSASVWTNNWQQGEQIATRLESGMVAVNRLGNDHPAAPFGGVKHSGFGREGGQWTVAGMTEPQVVSIQKNASK